MTQGKADDEDLRKDLEASGLYKVLIYLHEQDHTEDCFCTTEISGAYGKLLDIIQSLLERRELEARIDEIEQLTARCGQSLSMGINPLDLATDLNIRLAELSQLRNPGGGKGSE